MALRADAKFVYGLSRARFMPLNADLKLPKPSRIVGGVGPFDFSTAVSISAVVLKWKIDAGTEQTDTIDLSAASDPYAVTVDELVTAFGTSAPTGLTGSKETGTLRFKVALTAPGTTKYLQVYGEFAELCGIGQGLGCKWIRSSTFKTFQVTPTVKENTTHTTTPATGLDVEVIIEGYKKGFTATIVDSAEDFELMELIEGGVIDADGYYQDPSEESVKKYFMVEIFSPYYGEGSNHEGDLEGWEQKILKSCAGSVNEETHQSEFMDKTYALVGTNYTDELGVRSGAIEKRRLTVAAYEALDVDVA